MGALPYVAAVGGVKVMVCGDGFNAEQVAVVPPFVLLQLQFHVTVPVTDEGVPLVQRLAEGAIVKVWPPAVPQVPLIGSILKAAVTVQSALIISVV